MIRAIFWQAFGFISDFIAQKGFACAYRVVFGGSSCLGAAYLRRYGLFSGCQIFRKRLAHCRYAHDFARSQRGCYCDVPDVDDCNLGCHTKECLGDVATSCDICDCNNGRTQEKAHIII